MVAAARPLVGPAVKTTDPFYLSPEWRRVIQAVKRQRGYVCQQCGKDCSVEPRNLIGDHIVERKDGGADLDPLNIRLLCTACHNRKTAGARSVRMGVGR